MGPAGGRRRRGISMAGLFAVAHEVLLAATWLFGHVNGWSWW